MKKFLIEYRKKFRNNINLKYSQLFEEEIFVKLIDEFKFNRCDDTFSQGDYNFEIFQHSMEKIFEEERKEKEEQERIENEMNPKSTSFFSFDKNSNLFYWFSFLFIFISVGCLGYQYFNIKSIGPSKFT